MIDKIKVSAVNYLNTKPLTYGFDKTDLINLIDLSYDYPAEVARKLINKDVAIGLVPVATIPLIPNATIISDYCIASNGDVASVCIFSEVPIESITSLYLDYQSRTSVQLAQLLLKSYWQKTVTPIPAPNDFIDKIKGTTAGVIIGDRALENINKFPYVYDLAYYWKQWTGLPFVFAAWIANQPLDASFINAFNAANKYGFEHLQQVIDANQQNYYSMALYYQENISYLLNDGKIKALNLFLKYLYPEYQLNSKLHAC